ncbi:hypothetical protein AB0B10_25170 [Micromonospora arborensis]|uniref:hypothetical protein n=1 Tax=Micromonospora arborensis TaxID=2116518 RepID=UPI00340D521D
MPAILQVLLVLAGGLLLVALLAKIHSRRIDGPDASIVVVDRRTYLLAPKRITAALDQDDLARAHSGMTALRLWLKQEIRYGPKRRRREYAHALEQWELRAEQAGFAGIVDS